LRPQPISPAAEHVPAGEASVRTARWNRHLPALLRLGSQLALRTVQQEMQSGG